MHLLAYVMRPRPRLCRKILQVSAASFNNNSSSNNNDDDDDYNNQDDDSPSLVTESPVRTSQNLRPLRVEGGDNNNPLSPSTTWWSPDVAIHFRTADKHEEGAQLMSKFKKAIDKMFPASKFHGRAMFSSDSFEAIHAFRKLYGG